MSKYLTCLTAKLFHDNIAKLRTCYYKDSFCFPKWVTSDVIKKYGNNAMVIVDKENYDKVKVSRLIYEREPTNIYHIKKYKESS